MWSVNNDPYSFLSCSPNTKLKFLLVIPHYSSRSNIRLPNSFRMTFSLPMSRPSIRWTTTWLHGAAGAPFHPPIPTTSPCPMLNPLLFCPNPPTRKLPSSALHFISSNLFLYFVRHLKHTCVPSLVGTGNDEDEALISHTIISVSGVTFSFSTFFDGASLSRNPFRTSFSFAFGSFPFYKLC